jgi:DHA1 family bicyclomycin/chloramphenicol resistance-like MFS transporter
MILAGLSMLGPFTIDTVFPAFARIGEQFGADTTAMQQVTSVYMLAFAVMSVFHGPLSDALGRKPVMIAGLIGYSLASVGCALAPNLGVLLVMRMLQGTFAGAATIVSRVVVRDMFAGPQAHRMMSRIMMIFSVAPAIAPVAGGWLLKIGEWPVIFWTIAGYGVLALLAVLFLLPETHPPGARSPLRVGAVVRSILEVGRHPAMIRLALVTAFAMGGQFLYIAAAPIIVVDLFGLGEQDFWVLFVPIIAGMLVGAWLSGRLADKVSRTRLVDVALACALGAGLLNVVLMLIHPHLPLAMVAPALLSCSIAIAFPVIQLEILDTFPEHRGAAASLGTLASLGFNALLAGVISPLVTASLLTVAVAAAGFVLAGFLLWVGHRRAAHRTG